MRGPRRIGRSANLIELAVGALAVYRATKLILDDEIFAEPREALLRRFPPDKTKIGFGLTCPWCVSVWLGAAVAAGYRLAPNATSVACTALALSTLTGEAYERL